MSVPWTSSRPANVLLCGTESDGYFEQVIYSPLIVGTSGARIPEEPMMIVEAHDLVWFPVCEKSVFPPHIVQNLKNSRPTF